MGHSILYPKPLNEWLLLLDNTALPVHTGQKERVQKVMANPNRTLGEISRVVSEAPSIALILFREANRTSNSLSGPAHTLDTVLKRLGMKRCINLLASLMDESKVPIPANLRQVWLIGQHANRHTNALFAHKMARLWQEIHWGSLLFFSPIWPLLTRHPELLDIWEQRVIGNKEPAHKVERELLGVPLIKLCYALAKHWSLPQWIIDGYATLSSNPQMIGRALYLARLHKHPLEQQHRLDKQKELNAWLNQPANSIVLANGLALASHNSWGDNHCLRWQRLISLYLRQPLAAVQQKLHQTSVEHARYLGPTDLWHPAQALIWPWDVQRIQPHRSTSTTTMVNGPAQQASAEQATHWHEEAQQLTLQPSPFRNTLQLLGHYARLLQHGALSRVLILNIQYINGDSILTPVCQLGYHFPKQKPLPDHGNNPVFRHVFRHQRPLHIHTQNYGQVADHLDSGFLEMLNSKNFVMSGIWHKNKPFFLVIADAWGHPLQAESIKAFLASNQHLEQALSLTKKA